MLNGLKTLSFKKIMLAVTGGLILTLIPVIMLAFLILRKADVSSDQAALIEFEYCGASPAELCILSFGRDGAGNALINFFVPNKKFPGFYLLVKKAGPEDRYECRKSSEIKTSVFCTGGPLSLRQTIEVNLLAEEDDQLLATGSFFIEAFLVAAQNAQVLPETTDQTADPFSLEQGLPAATNPATGKISPTVTPTVTPSSSYPYP
jgi:hypothetical protein